VALHNPQKYLHVLSGVAYALFYYTCNKQTTMADNIHQSEDNRYIPMTSISGGKGNEIRPDLYYYTNQIVNVIFVGNPKTGEWVLVDAGMPYAGPKILEEAARRFGNAAKPRAIILTHGHFDHVGGIVHLIEKWKVPVYSHPLEFPYLTGAEDYPEPDTTVEGGLLAKISSIYPHKSIDILDVLLPLPANGSIPHMPGWKWLHTPGHSPGHVSFFRDSDRTLIAGDAFVTVKADSLYKVLVQKKEVNGPPRYFTTDWEQARRSVQLLNNLQPLLAITGHGTHMDGEALAHGLEKLAAEFDQVAVPGHGKYVTKKDG
jgi:glyoxylase-like metal-dependent hydrolase (beta-lactamase superfamily II)